MSNAEHVTDDEIAELIQLADIMDDVGTPETECERATNRLIILARRAGRELLALRAPVAMNDRAKLEAALHDPETAEGAAALLNIMGPPSTLAPHAAGMSDEKWSEIRQYLLDGRWLTKANARLLVQDVDAARALRAPVDVAGNAAIERLLWAADEVRMRSRSSGERFTIPADVYAELREALDSLVDFDGTGSFADAVRRYRAAHVERAAVLAREAEGLRAKLAMAFGEVAAGLERERAMRQQLALVSTSTAGVWRWQGDGHDDPASLACPVVMGADTLRSMVARIETVESEVSAARAEIDRLKAAAVVLQEQAGRAEDARDLYDAIKAFCDNKVAP